MSQTPTTTTTLYQHKPHPHTPRNPNEIHAEERRAKAQRPGWRGRVSAVNLWLATHITTAVGTMWAAYLFSLLALSGFPGTHATPAQLVQWFSQTFLQLVFLPILSVGTAVLGRGAQILAEQMYHGIMRLLHELSEIAHHLNAQDAELLRQSELLLHQSSEQREQMEELKRQTAMLTTLVGHLVADAAATASSSPAPDPAPDPAPVASKRSRARKATSSTVTAE